MFGSPMSAHERPKGATQAGHVFVTDTLCDRHAPVPRRRQEHRSKLVIVNYGSKIVIVKLI